MKVIYKSFKFRLYPNQSQEVLLNKHFGSVRYVYNHFLNQRKEQYLDNGKSDSFNKQCKSLTKLKKDIGTKWLKEINSQSLQQSLRHLENSYVNFYRGTTQFPKFKSRKSRNSFSIPQFIKIEDGKLFIPKFKKGIKFNEHRNIEGEIRNGTISKSTTGKYYISLMCQVIHKPMNKTGNDIGIDLGLKNFMITSNNNKFKNNKYTKKYEKKLEKSQKHLSRKQKGSNSYEKQRRKVALIHEKITNSRKDNLHKISHEIVKNYDTICVENLNIKCMVKNRILSKSISDASWGTFLIYLQYKCEWNDKQLIKIDRFFPSSKTCNICGWIKQDLKLSDREWLCPCGINHDRDINASKNILKQGLNIKSAGMVDNNNGDINKTSDLEA